MRKGLSLNVRGLGGKVEHNLAKDFITKENPGVVILIRDTKQSYYRQLVRNLWGKRK